MKKILLLLLTMIISLGGVMSLSSCNKKGTVSADDLKNVISSAKLVSGDPVSVANSPVYQNQAVDVAAPKNHMEEKETGRTGEEITIDRSGTSGYGGGQFISKLFTEALSRAATGEEYAAFQSYLIENGCTAQSLQVLAEAVFSSELFESFNLTNREIAFCVYRAILARDPSDDELASFSKKNLMNTLCIQIIYKQKKELITY